MAPPLSPVARTPPHPPLHSPRQFNLHYGETLRRWRANFNAVAASVVRPLGFEPAFVRTMNYYFAYCEAGFSSATLGLQVLTLTRPGNAALVTNAPAGRLAGGAVDACGPWDSARRAVPTGVV